MVTVPAVPARGEIWWAHLPGPAGSGPGYRRPVLVVSADSFNLKGAIGADTRAGDNAAIT